RSPLRCAAPGPCRGGDRNRSAARCDRRGGPPLLLAHTANTSGRPSPRELPGWRRYQPRRNPARAHAPRATARRRGRHWTHNVHRVTRWPSDDSVLPTIPLLPRHAIAPIPFTIVAPSATARPLRFLISLFAGLIPRAGPCGIAVIGDRPPDSRLLAG